MKSNLVNLARRYKTALRSHLQQGLPGRLDSARGLGSQALEAGLQTLDLAKLHEEILVAEVLPGIPAAKRPGVIKRAGAFFAVAITPIEKTHPSARQATLHLKKFIETLSQRTVELAASNLELSLEIAQRKAVEEKLRRSERHYSELLRQSDTLQEHLRHLSRLILSAQEDERKRISRELHDVIAQTLTSINVRLANLKAGAALSNKGLDRNIARTQRLVEHSVDIVHQFARELRPAVLDDLGLIPALHTFMKTFRQQTGIRVTLCAFAAVEKTNDDKRIVLYRVAQEALNNIARHSEATRADVSIEQLNGSIAMEIKDNGKGFAPGDPARGKGNNRLGLLGMRERLEMVGGKVTIHSAPGKGTAVRVELPMSDKPTRLGGWRTSRSLPA
jgi:signal transduction histidine kinase